MTYVPPRPVMVPWTRTTRKEELGLKEVVVKQKAKTHSLQGPNQSHAIGGRGVSEDTRFSWPSGCHRRLAGFRRPSQTMMLCPPTGIFLSKRWTCCCCCCCPCRRRSEGARERFGCVSDWVGWANDSPIEGHGHLDMCPWIASCAKK